VSKSKSIDRHIYTIKWSDEDDEFVATCCEFPSLSYLDESQSKALAGIQRLVQRVTKDLQQEKQDFFKNPAYSFSKAERAKLKIAVSHFNKEFKKLEKGKTFTAHFSSTIEKDIKYTVHWQDDMTSTLSFDDELNFTDTYAALEKFLVDVSKENIKETDKQIKDLVEACDLFADGAGIDKEDFWDSVMLNDVSKLKKEFKND